MAGPHDVENIFFYAVSFVYEEAISRRALRVSSNKVQFREKFCGPLTILFTKGMTISAPAFAAAATKTCQSSIPSLCASKRTVDTNAPTPVASNGPGSTYTPSLMSDDREIKCAR